ncbi:MAG: ABC transporter substrate-binding protein [Saprospiraceae bacterium]|jgi:NitT/TauT family transport system substrate-binding protein|nr:MAG: ABC transporter substrate-binding protein [Saprospiraceae bacterium]
MKKNIIIIILLVAVAIVGYLIWNSNNKSVDQQKEKYQASLRFGWIPSASFAGEIAGMNKFADRHNLSLKCEAGGPGLNSIQLVQTGQNTFGTIAADEVLAANDKGADFVIIGVINYFSPGAFASLTNRNIKTPKDFEGKKVGLLPFGSTTLLYESLIRKNNVDKSKITEIVVSSDLKPFIAGKYDVQPVFVYDETVTLDMQNIKYNLIEPKDFGVDLKGPVYFCKRETYEKNPEMVKAFIETVADGWNYAIKNIDTSIAMLKSFAPEVNVEREKKVLEKAIPYYTLYKGQPINSDYDSWNETINELKTQGIIKKDIDIRRVVHLDYINAYYK